MRPLLFPLFLWATAADADLYRWIDPESGSVKYSSVAPSWYGDGERQGRAPAVEVVPYAPMGVPARKPEEAATPGRTAVATLEARWRAFLQSFSTLTASDFERAGPGLGEQLKAYQGLAAELDRLDPAGRKRRQAEETLALEKLKK
ncbi:MAG: hypothetical protein K0R40_641 [Burkholderiales bacterium]|jgi:hypothetical protein|nr:hypothetical protein [Burkholderiales bacterium]